MSWSRLVSSHLYTESRAPESATSRLVIATRIHHIRDHSLRRRQEELVLYRSSSLAWMTSHIYGCRLIGAGPITKKKQIPVNSYLWRATAVHNNIVDVGYIWWRFEEATRKRRWWRRRTRHFIVDRWRHGSWVDGCLFFYYFGLVLARLSAIFYIQIYISNLWNVVGKKRSARALNYICIWKGVYMFCVFSVFGFIRWRCGAAAHWRHSMT